MADPQPVKVPPTFKSLLPFIRRAEELDRDSSRPESKLIAYFCRQYAMELGIKLRENDASNESTDYLLSLMDRLEDEKNKLPDFTQEEGKEICEDFAIEIFSKADDEDRAGLANKSTARTFYAAGTFFDILAQFGEISEDVVEKRRYCKYKAATILKAIKEGTTPTPGPPEGLDLASTDRGIEDAPMASTVLPSNALPPAPVAPPTPSPPPPQQQSAPMQDQSSFPSLTGSVNSVGSGGSMNGFGQDNNGSWRAPSPVPVPSPSPPPSQPMPPVPSAPSAPAQMYQPSPSNYTAQSTPTRSRGGPVSQNEINDAIECAKFAIAALKVKDMKLAEERLEMALRSIR